MAKAETALRALFTIGATASFLDTLARALLDGHLPRPHGVRPTPEALARMTVLLPTRRAARELREAFMRAAPNEAALLPRIRPIGDPDELALLMDGEAGALFGEEADAELPPAIGALDRQLALAMLVMRWRRLTQEAALATPGAPHTEQPAQALLLAQELAGFMDVIDTERADLAGLAGLAPAEFAEHWQRTLDFLTIVTEHWPDHLVAEGRMGPMARRNALLVAEAGRLRASPPPDPIIAAGSTGTAPATAELLGAIAALPNGAVVLPGLDRTLDVASWEAVGEHPEHPQFGMARLLAKLGADRADVAPLPGDEASDGDLLRMRLIGAAMRPASAAPTDFSDFAPEKIAAALAPLSILVAPSAEDEAELIALILRGAIETPGKTAALVTPDRALARRVSARLLRWDLRIDDSAGKPVAETPPGAFLQLVLEVFASDFAPAALMALLKHPLTRLGWTAGECRTHARSLELLAFRGSYATGGGLEGIRIKPPSEKHDHPARKRLSGRDVADAEKLFARLKAAYAPLAGLDSRTPYALADLARAHVAIAETLAHTERGASDAIWRGEAGEALALVLTGVITATVEDFVLTPGAYPAAYGALVAGHVVRPRAPAHPRLAIMGTLEARLQRTDLVVLGGLNEGIWPRNADSGPWLSRPMRQALGLPLPERFTGLAAHDFTQALGAKEVFLTRAEKVNGVQTVPSRWLQRLRVLRQRHCVDERTGADRDWLAWARARDDVAVLDKPKPPAPRPPVEARPIQLSVTDVQRWMANPYEIFAKKILGLEAMPALERAPDAALRGGLVHEILREFAKLHPDALPPDIAGALMLIAERLFAAFGGHAPVVGFWRPQFARFAKWFAATEPARRADVAALFSEIRGTLALATPRGFTLTARADRIDLLNDGTLAIYDYKTGSPPTSREVETRKAPQLLLEAAIAQAGGFPGVGAHAVGRLVYIRASGGRIEGEEKAVCENAPRQAVEDALAGLTALAAAFESQDTPYAALRRQMFKEGYRFDAYAHLARVLEWATEEALDV